MADAPTSCIFLQSNHTRMRLHINLLINTAYDDRYLDEAPQGDDYASRSLLLQLLHHQIIDYILVNKSN
jgi:hypothetical protein